jgi:hypothetical protein
VGQKNKLMKKNVTILSLLMDSKIKDKAQTTLHFKIREHFRDCYGIFEKVWGLFWWPLYDQPKMGFETIEEAQEWLDAYVEKYKKNFCERNRPKKEIELKYPIEQDYKYVN